MFIKKINKIQAPLKTSSFSSKKFNRIVQPKHKTNQVTGKNQQIKKLQSLQQPLKVLTISIDPHANYISFYSQQSDTIYLVSIVTLIDYIDTYRTNFPLTHQYSFKSSLKSQLQIQNPRPSLNIFQIKFSHCLQNTQFLIIAYYTGIIDIYSVVSGKKIDGIDIMDSKLVDSQQNKTNDKDRHEIQQNKSPIYNIHVIGHSIFVSTYDGKLLCYEGRQLRRCNKYENQWIRFCYDQIQQYPQQYSIDNKKKIKITQPRYKKLPLYKTKTNSLYLGNNLIYNPQLNTKQILQKLQKKQTLDSPNILSQSYLQYLKLQSQKIPQNIHKKYSLSICQNYLICYNGQTGYLIRSKQNKWDLLSNYVFRTLPVVNQFWGIQKIEKLGKNKDRGNSIVEYFLGSQQILLAVVGDYEVNQTQQLVYNENQTVISIIKLIPTEQQKQNEKEKEKSKKITKQKHQQLKKQDEQYKIVVISKIIQAKYNIVQIYWIGPNILLYLDQNGNVYYVEIQAQILMTIQS